MSLVDFRRLLTHASSALNQRSVRQLLDTFRNDVKIIFCIRFSIWLSACKRVLKFYVYRPHIKNSTILFQVFYKIQYKSVHFKFVPFFHTFHAVLSVNTTSSVKIDAVCSSETLLTDYNITQCHNPKAHNWNFQNQLFDPLEH